MRKISEILHSKMLHYGMLHSGMLHNGMLHSEILDGQMMRDNINYFIARIEVWFLMLLFPVIMHHKLYDVTQTRYRSFLVVSAICLIGVFLNNVIFIIISIIRKEKTQILKEVYVSDIIAAVMLLSAIFAYLVSPYKRYALNGIVSRWIGLIFMLAIASMYYIISRYYRIKENDIMASICVAFLVNLLAVINFMGIDLFGCFDGLSQVDSYRFISTIGNIDVYGVYAVITTSVTLCCAVKMNLGVKKILSFLFSFIGMMGIIASGSDAAFAGIIVFMAAAFFVMLDSYHTIAEWGMIITAFLISEKIMYGLHMIFPDQCRPLEGLFELIGRDVSFIVIALLLLIIAFLQFLGKRRPDGFDKKVVTRLRGCYLGAVCIVSAIIIIMVFYATKKGDIQLPPEYSVYFIMNDQWGTGRGYIWRNLMDAFSHMPIINILFGSGEATVRNVLSDYATEHWNLLFGSVVDNAHSIPLQYLATMGLVGAASYLAMLIECIKKLLMNIHQKQESSVVMLYTAIGLACVAVMIQNIFCIMEVITFPIFIGMLAIMNGCERQQGNLRKTKFE